MATQGNGNPNQNPEYQYNGFQIPSANYPSPTNSFAQGAQSTVMGQQGNIADQYQKNLKNNATAQYNNAATTANQNLAQSIRGVKEDFNARGLLNSGGRATAQYGAINNSNAGLANTALGINTGLMNNANTLTNNAISAGYNYANANPNLGQLYGNANAANVQNSLANSMAQQNLYTGIGNAAGQGLGYVLAGNTSPQYNNSVNPNWGMDVSSSSPGYGAYY